MDLFSKLFAEHRLIGRVLDAFEAYLDAVDAAGTVNPHDFTRFVTFFREYADLLHHEREESVLFPALARHGFAENRGPLAHVRGEHRTERELMTRLLRIATRRDPWSQTQAISSIGRELVAFQRAHIAKENELLYPVAQREISPEGPALVARELAEFDEDRGRHGHTDWLEALGEELIGDYAPPLG